MSDADAQAGVTQKLPNAADFFAALGLPKRFDLTHAQVSRAYLAASRSWQAQEDAERRQQALDVINQAKMVLLNAEARAGHLLALLAGRGTPDDASQRALPAGFLMAMMERREQLAAAHERGDTPAIEAFEVWTRAQREGYVREVTPLFAMLAEAQATEAQRAGAIREIRKVLNAWRYIERMMEQLRPANPPADDA